MGSNRFSKPPPVDYTPKAKKPPEEVWVEPKACFACKKVVKGAYGMTMIQGRVEWSCSGKCEKVLAKEKESERFLTDEV